MAFSLVNYLRKTYGIGVPPAYDDTTDLNAREAALEKLSQDHDAETAPGRALVEALTASAQRMALGLGDSATKNVGTGSGDVAAGNAPVAAAQDPANVQAAAVATAEVTSAPAHWWVLVGGALKRMTHAGWQLLVRAELPSAIEGGTATVTPLDTDIIPGVKADHSRLYYTWANLKTTLIAAFKATSANLVTGTSDVLFPTVKSLKDATALADFFLTKRTKMPDGATAVWSSNAWELGASAYIAGVGVSGSVTSGVLTVTPAATSNRFKVTGISIAPGQTVLFRAKRTAGLTHVISASFRNSSEAVLYGIDFTPTSEFQIFRLTAPVTATEIDRLYIYADSFDGTQPMQLDFVWIGDYSYLPGSLSEEAARIANQRGNVAASGQFASQTITATDLATATKGDTIGGKKYTFVAALTASPGVEGEVLKGATKEEDLENLNLAISEAARTNNGVKYWAAAVHPLVSSARVNAVLTLTAKTNNGTENGITVVCESGTNHTAGGATLLGGYTDSAAKTIAEIQNNIAASGTRPAAAMISDTVTDVGYETTVDVAAAGTYTLPAGGTWRWCVYGYGATVSSAKRGSSAGGTTLTVAGANATLWVRKVA